MMKITSELNEKIRTFIEAQEQPMIDDIIRLIAIPSLRAQESSAYPFGPAVAQALDAALALANACGFETENHDYFYGSCTLRGLQGGKTLGMVCHLDVVPAGDGAWSRPPFEGYVKDGYIVGRGSTDNKGPLGAALYVMKFFKESGIPLKNDLRLIFGCDEESGMQDMEHLLATDPAVPCFTLVPDAPFPVCYAEKGRLEFTAKAKLAGNLDALHAGEAANSTPASARAILSGVSLECARAQLSGCDVAVEARGDEIEVSARGVSKHTATPEGAVDALNILARALCGSKLLTEPAQRMMQALSGFTDGHNGEGFGIAYSEKVLGSLTHSCSLAQTQDGELTVRCDVRYPAGARFEGMRESIRRALDTAGFTLCSIEDNAPNYVDPNSEIVQALAAIANEQMGTDFPPVAMNGGTYARKLPRAVGYGPSRPDIKKPFPQGHGWAHQTDEAVRIANLTDMIKTYIPALMMLDAQI